MTLRLFNQCTKFTYILIQRTCFHRSCIVTSMWKGYEDDNGDKNKTINVYFSVRYAVRNSKGFETRHVVNVR